MGKEKKKPQVHRKDLDPVTLFITDFGFTGTPQAERMRAALEKLLSDAMDYGYAEGREEGFDNGYTNGYENGYSYGYESGYETGFEAGDENGY